MIVKADFYTVVKNALDDYTNGAYKQEKNAPRHMSIMASAMKSYLEDNLVISYAWAATNPATGVVDPVVSFNSTVTFTTFSIISPQTKVGLASQVQASVMTGIITHAAGFTIPPGSFLPLPLVLPSETDATKAFMNTIISPIYDWIKTLVNVTPISGAHAAFTGAATMASIS